MRNSIIVIMILTFSGCSKFIPQRMIKQKKVTIESIQTNNNFSIHTKLLSQEERANHFNHFKILECNIKNHTNQPLLFDQSSISLPLASAKTVYKKEPKLYTAYFIPAIFSTISAYFFWFQLALPLATGCSLLAAHASGKINSSNINHLKKLTLFAKDALIIKPKSSKTFLLFIEKSAYKPNFTYTLTIPENKITQLIVVNMQATTASYFKVQG